MPEYPLRCRVAGWPATKGHKTSGTRKNGTRYVRETGGAKLEDWLANLQDGMRAMMEEAGAEPLDVPVFYRVTFLFPWTQALTRTWQKTGEFDPPYPIGKTGDYAGDLDTLLRGIGDAGSKAGVWRDDCLIVGGLPWKRWAPEGESSGAQIQVWPASMIDTKG